MARLSEAFAALRRLTIRHQTEPDHRQRDVSRFLTASASCPSTGPVGPPPAPPIRYTPTLACDPATDMGTLWQIARNHPHLRRWLIANPRADAEILEYVAQAGGPGVKEAFDVLFDDSLDDSAPGPAL